MQSKVKFLNILLLTPAIFVAVTIPSRTVGGSSNINLNWKFVEIFSKHIICDIDLWQWSEEETLRVRCGVETGPSNMGSPTRQYFRHPPAGYEDININNLTQSVFTTEQL